MPLLPSTRARRSTARIAPRHAAPTTRSSALPASVAARVRLSADVLAALLEVEGRQHATLDDIEWADAVAARLLARRASRSRAA